MTKKSLNKITHGAMAIALLSPITQTVFAADDDNRANNSDKESKEILG